MQVAIDQARVFGAQRRRVQAQLGDRAGAQVLQHHVGIRNDVAAQFGPRRLVLQVQRDGFLVAVDAVVDRGAAAPERRSEAAGIVTAVRSFDLPDFRAQFGQDPGAVRPGHVAAQLDDLDAGERLRPVHAFSSR
jgi:hypothetical protein